MNCFWIRLLAYHHGVEAIAQLLHTGSYLVEFDGFLAAIAFENVHEGMGFGLFFFWKVSVKRFSNYIQFQNGIFNPDIKNLVIVSCKGILYRAMTRNTVWQIIITTVSQIDNCIMCQYKLCRF